MTKSTYLKYNFNGGELSPLLDARVDYPKYGTGAKEMTNFVPTVYGPMTKRPGTRFVDSITSDTAPVLLPFEFNEEQSYVMALVDQRMDFYTRDGRLVDETLTPVSVVTPYAGEDVQLVRMAQTADIAYFTHPSYPPYKLSRTAIDAFTFEEVLFIDGPFDDANITDEEFSVVGTTTAGGTVTITDLSASGRFDDGDLGRYIKFEYIPSTQFDTWEPESHDFNGSDIKYNTGDNLTYLSNVYEVTAADTGVTLPSRTGRRSPLHETGSASDGNLILTYVGDSFGYAQVETIVNSDEVTAIVIKDLPIGISDTTDWAMGSYSPKSGYPSNCVFHQQRLVYGGTIQRPQTVFGSEINLFENFKSGTDDDNSYQFTLAATKQNRIVWMVSNEFLQVGTLGSEFSIASTGGTITPTDVNASQISTYGGSQESNAIVTNGFTLFVQAGGNKIRELRFDDNTKRSYARDLNKVAEHLSQNGRIIRTTYQAEPYQVIWVVIGEKLFALTYEVDEDVYAWHEHFIGGEVASVSSIPTNYLDRVWITVKRENENGEYWSIEFIERFYTGDQPIEDMFFVDSGLTYEGPATTTLTGLDHLEGITVSVLNNGSVEPKKVVVDGAIEVDYPTTKCHVGLELKSIWQSMRLEGGSQEGVAQGKSKHIKNIILRLINTGAGLLYGRGGLDNGVPVSVAGGLFPVRTTTDDMDEPPPLVSGDTQLEAFEGGWSKEMMVRLEHNQPTACTVVAWVSQVETNER